AVDARTEAAILDAIERQRQARTVVLVTHRVAAAARCDSVVVLDQGRVIERGTHDELVAAGGLYAAFAAEQSAKSELERGDVDGAQGVVAWATTPPPPARPPAPFATSTRSRAWAGPTTLSCCAGSGRSSARTAASCWSPWGSCWWWRR